MGGRHFVKGPVSLSLYNDAYISCRQVYVNKAGVALQTMAAIQAIKSMIQKHFKKSMCRHATLWLFLKRHLCILCLNAEERIAQEEVDDLSRVHC